MQTGAWVDPITAKPPDVINPATDAVAGRISMGTAADVAKAAKAARAVFETWSQSRLDDSDCAGTPLILEPTPRASFNPVVRGRASN